MGGGPGWGLLTLAPQFVSFFISVGICMIHIMIRNTFCVALLLLHKQTKTTAYGKQNKNAYRKTETRLDD